MKKLSQRIQRLSQQAAQVRQVIESVPQRAEELRTAVTSVTGQVQQLRSDLLASVDALTLETGDQLAAALKEIDTHADVFAQAGFRLDGADLDLGTVGRLSIQLERVNEVSTARLRALHAAQHETPRVQAILSAILKAEDFAAGEEFENLEYTRLHVQLGAIPSVRIGWRAPAATQSNPPQAAPTPAVAPTGSSSFFERRESHAAAAQPTPPPPDTTKTPAVIAPAAATSAKTRRDWGASSLERFKKMPL